MLNKAQTEFLNSLLSRARARKSTFPRYRTTQNWVGDDVRSGPGPDERDPATLSGLIDRLVVNKGWDLQVATGRIYAQWPTVVGFEVADHVVIETFEFDPSGQSGLLVVRADSTAWATQIRLMIPTIQKRLDEELGEGRIAEIIVNGPVAPSWKHGLRSVPGRGPRDTYG